MVVWMINRHHICSLKFNSFDVVKWKVNTWIHVCLAIVVLIELSHSVSAFISCHVMLRVDRLEVVRHLSTSGTINSILVVICLVLSISYLIILVRHPFCLRCITEWGIKFSVAISRLIDWQYFAQSVWLFVAKDSNSWEPLHIIISFWRVPNRFCYSIR